MTEPQNANVTSNPSDPAAVPPAPAGPDIVGNFKKLRLSEKIVVSLALLVEVGWIITWSSFGGWQYSGLSQWFPMFSFFGALVVVALVVLKVLAIKALPPNLEKHAIPVATLLPVLGFLIQSVSSISGFLTMVGSLAMAYVSATTYWRKHIPDLSAALTEEGAAPRPPEQPSAKP